jgi:hypothetical protein
MQCSNPQCAKELRHLRGGRVELLELMKNRPTATDFRHPYMASSFGSAVTARRRTSSSDGQLPALS